MTDQLDPKNVRSILRQHEGAASRAAYIHGLWMEYRRRERIENAQLTEQDLREVDAALDAWLERRAKRSRSAA